MCVFVGGGRKKGRDLVVSPRFVVYGGPNKYRFFVTVSLYRIMYQISLPCIMVTQMYE